MNVSLGRSRGESRAEGGPSTRLPSGYGDAASPMAAMFMNCYKRLRSEWPGFRTLSSRGPRYRLFESKFHRDSDFETPVAIFVLQIERYAVATGTAAVRRIERGVAIDNTFVDGALGHLIVAVIEIETGLCRRGRCAVSLRND
jgi:hypothetical protein